MTKLEEVLGRAYVRAEIQADKPAAVAFLRHAIATDPELQTTAREEMARLAEVVAARTDPGTKRCGCHLSKVQFELLASAFSNIPVE